MKGERNEPEDSLEERLRQIEEQLERQMRERGFEPSQAELVALPGPLAELYVEREELRADLEELKNDSQQTETSEQSE